MVVIVAKELLETRKNRLDALQGRALVVMHVLSDDLPVNDGPRVKLASNHGPRGEYEAILPQAHEEGTSFGG